MRSTSSLPHFHQNMNLLTPCSWILLEKLTGSHLVKKFPALYGTQRFITRFTSARHLSISWARSIQSVPPHLTSRRSILLSSHLRLVSQVVSLPQVSPTKPCIRLPYPPYMLHAPPISFFSILSPEQYWVSSTHHSAPHYTSYVNAVRNDSAMDAGLIAVCLGLATVTNELFDVGKLQLVRERP